MEKESIFFAGKEVSLRQIVFLEIRRLKETDYSMKIIDSKKNVLEEHFSKEIDLVIKKEEIISSVTLLLKDVKAIEFVDGYTNMVIFSNHISSLFLLEGENKKSNLLNIFLTNGKTIKKTFSVSTNARKELFRIQEEAGFYLPVVLDFAVIPRDKVVEIKTEKINENKFNLSVAIVGGGKLSTEESLYGINYIVQTINFEKNLV